MFEKKDNCGGIESLAMDSRAKLTEKQQQEINSLLFSTYMNMSLIYMKQEKYSRAIEVLSSALSLQNTVKALVRRATCFLELNEPEKALDDLNLTEQMEKLEFSEKITELTKKAQSLINLLTKKSGFKFSKMFS